MIRNTARPSAPATNPTRDWVIDQLVNKRLDHKLASHLHRRYPVEEYDRLLSFVGELLAKWANRDTFASYLANGTLTVNMVKRWTRQKWVTQMSRLGTEPLHRMHGKRSEVEIEANRFAGDDLATMSDTALVGEAHQAEIAALYDDEGERVGSEVVDSAMNPEEAVAATYDKEAALAEGRRYVAATFRDAADRYLSIFDALFVRGESRDEIAEREGCSVQRISQLSTKVRNSVRDGQIIRDDARRLFDFLSASDESDWSAIRKGLRLDKPRLKRAAAYLAQDGIEIVEVDANVYSLTAGHNGTNPTES